MPLVDGKFIEDSSIDLGKLKETVVKKSEFDSVIDELAAGSQQGVSALANELNTRITEENGAALSVDGAAYGSASTFAGAANSPVNVTLSQSMKTIDYIVSVLPRVNTDAQGKPSSNAPSELASIGTIGYRIIDNQHVAVYNTGSATTTVGFSVIAFRKNYIP